MATSTLGGPVAYEQSINPDGTYHYEGELGSFDYDPAVFQVQTASVTMEDGTPSSVHVLRYIGKETDGSKISIPEGLTSGHLMFANTDITSVPKLPKSLQNADSMFQNCRRLRSARVVFPASLSSAAFMFANCGSLTDGPRMIPGTVKNANFLFAGCTQMQNTPVLGNGIQYGEFLFANCKSLTRMPNIPPSLRESDHMTYDCDGLDRVARERQAARVEKERERMEKKLDRPGFLAQAGSAFSAVMQCHAMRQMGYGFIMAPVMTYLMRKNGGFSKTFSGGMAAMAMTRPGGSLLNYMAAQSAKKEQQKAAQQREKKRQDLASFDRAHADGVHYGSDQSAAAKGRQDVRKGLCSKVLSMSSSEKMVYRERFGGTYRYREEIMTRMADRPDAFRQLNRSMVSKWYKQQMSAAAAYYREAEAEIQNGTQYGTKAEKAEAMRGLRELSRMQMEPLMASAERMQSQYHLFNDGDLMEIDRITRDLPSEQAKGATFSSRYRPGPDTAERVRRTMEQFSFAEDASGPEDDVSFTL